MMSEHPGEDDPSRLPSSGSGDPCNRCDIDPAEILRRDPPEPTPADPPEPREREGGGGGHAGTIQ